jgi:hypothetical protein
MDVTVKINKLPCSHVILTYTSGTKTMTKVTTIQELREALVPDSLDEVEQLLFGQMRKIIVENPLVSLSNLKTLIEGTVFKV